jgi:hypothetical protein
LALAQKIAPIFRQATELCNTLWLPGPATAYRPAIIARLKENAEMMEIIFHCTSRL